MSSYLDRFMPASVRPYGREIVGGAAGYAAWRMLFGRIHRRGQKYRALDFGVVAGIAASDVLAEGTSAVVPNLVGLGAVLLSSKYGGRISRKVHSMTYKISYNASDYIMTGASYVAGKYVAKKVL